MVHARDEFWSPPQAPLIALSAGGTNLFLALLPRKIMAELLWTTLLALSGISIVMTLVLAMVEAGRRGLDPIRVILLMPYMLPTMLPYTLPTCLLYACTVVYGGMSGANEITAMKAGGIHVWRAVWPAILLSFIATGIGVYLTDRIIPLCNQRLSDLIMADLENALLSYLKTELRISGAGSEYEIVVKSVKGNKLMNPLFIHKDTANETDFNITGDEATMTVAPGEKPGDPRRILMKLVNGKMTPIGKGGNHSNAITHFGKEPLPMPVPTQLLREHEKKLECLTYLGCLERAKTYKQEAIGKDVEIAWMAAVSLLNGQPEEIGRQPKPDREFTERCVRKARESIGEVHLRANQSLAAIPFILLGCPLSILLQRRDAMQTFFICFVPIVTIFYPTMILTFNIFKEGQDEATLHLGAIMIWAPAALMTAVAVFAMRKLFRT